MNDVAFLNINGLDHGFKMNWYGIVQLSQLLNVDPTNAINEVSQLVVKDTPQGTTFIVYAGIVGYELEKNGVVNISISDVAVLVSRNDLATFNNAIQAFNYSTKTSKFLTKITDNEADDHSLAFEDLYEFAISDIGLMPNEFMSLTWYDYSLIISRHIKENAREWERSRFIAYWLYWANTDTDRDTLYDFLPLLTDPPPPEPDSFTEEDRIRIVQEAAMRSQIFKEMHK